MVKQKSLIMRLLLKVLLCHKGTKSQSSHQDYIFDNECLVIAYVFVFLWQYSFLLIFSVDSRFRVK